MILFYPFFTTDFLFFWACVFLVTTTLIALLKHEKQGHSTENDELKCGVFDTYKQLYKLLKLPSIKAYMLFALTYKVREVYLPPNYLIIYPVSFLWMVYYLIFWNIRVASPWGDPLVCRFPCCIVGVIPKLKVVWVLTGNQSENIYIRETGNKRKFSWVGRPHAC